MQKLIALLTLSTSLLPPSTSYAQSQLAYSSLPPVTQHNDPVYPPLARQTHISGDVVLKITTDGNSATDTVLVKGHPLLYEAAAANVRTWKFTDHAPSTFLVTFRYELHSPHGDFEFLKSPALIRVEAPEPVVDHGDYSKIDFGRWQVQWTVNGNSSQRVLQLYEAGPNDGLEGGFLGKHHQIRDESIDYGHKVGLLLSFTIKVHHSGGQSLETFFVGNLDKDKIIGTFVDENSATGAWAATRLPDKEPQKLKQVQ
jgi:Gram-negative bacterial TonB protein C-terminal